MFEDEMGLKWSEFISVIPILVEDKLGVRN